MADNVTLLPIGKSKSPDAPPPPPFEIIEDETVRHFRPAVTGNELDTPRKREAAFLTPGHPFRDEMEDVIEGAADDFRRSQAQYDSVPADAQWGCYLLLTHRGFAERQVAELDRVYSFHAGSHTAEHDDALERANRNLEIALSRLFNLPVTLIEQASQKQSLARRWHRDESYWPASWKTAFARDLEWITQRRAERATARAARRKPVTT